MGSSRSGPGVSASASERIRKRLRGGLASGKVKIPAATSAAPPPGKKKGTAA